MIARKTILGAGAAFGLLYVALSARMDVQGQSAAPTPPTTDTAKTNVTWLGSVVYGKEVAGVVGGPFPHAQEGIEIGLRVMGWWCGGRDSKELRRGHRDLHAENAEGRAQRAKRLQETTK
jgi:hypothetical protein